MPRSIHIGMVQNKEQEKERSKEKQKLKIEREKFSNLEFNSVISGFILNDTGNHGNWKITYVLDYP